MSKQPELTPHIKRMCNRLAMEQTKAQVWLLGQSLRDEYARRMGQGENAADLERELRRRMTLPCGYQALRAPNSGLEAHQ